MQNEKRLNRREFLTWTAVSAVGVLAASCAQPTPETIVKEIPVEKVVKETIVVEKEVAVEKVVKETVVVQKEVAVQKEVVATAAPVKYKEAPMLAKLVAAGKLPPVEERLPLEPCVMKGRDGIGKYGGTMRRCFNGVSDRWGPTKLQDRGFIWLDENLNWIPRLAKGWDINADATEWTWHLRKGMKWSDGEPFTSAAMQWRWDNQVLNKEITPGGVTGVYKDMTMTSPDDYTVVFKFPYPSPLFATRMGGRQTIWTPGHYMQQFHMDFTKDKAALEKEYKDKGINDWVSYFNDRDRFDLNEARPQVGAWLMKQPITAGEMFTMERNPYFWAVDEEGQQLPYIDKITHRLFGSADVRNMWVLNGEIDFQYRHMTFSDFTLYKEGEQKGDYKVFVGVGASHTAMQVNHTTKEPKLNEFFNNRDVRIALSHAVDRSVINEVVCEGLATPRQYSPIGLSPQYYPKLSNAYIEYDPKKSNELLDKAGYDKKGADGFRLWKDGSGPISFIIEGTDQTGTVGEDAVLVVCKYLADVGIKATYYYAERALYTQHYQSNEIEAASWGGDRTVLPLVAPIIWIGEQPDRPWCPGWCYWRTDKTSPTAMEPPAGHWIRDIWDIWDNQVCKEPDAKKQTELFWKILDIWAEELPYPTWIGEQPMPCIVKNGFRGYLPGMPLDDPTGDENLLNTETYYWENPEAHA
ncbi:MAG: ABC transporter substrate-binding protein [Chloroflexi bacterium]|nr:ABC transporter substrate-binding protein [Chloroflexota bacterium]